MSETHLGETFDIHGGGHDLDLPASRERDRAEHLRPWRPPVRPLLGAQRHADRCAAPRCRRSLGNFLTVRDVLDEAPGEAIRLALLTAHYRDPLDWTSERLRQARQTLDRFYRALTLPRDAVFERFGEADAALRPVRDALEDDLNTPLALTHLHELAGAINRTSSDAERSALQRALEAGGQLMGLLGQPPLDWLQGSEKADTERIEQHIAARTTARRAAPFRRGRPYPHRARRRGHPARRPAGRHDDLVAEGLSMAGTDHRRQAVTDGPAIILVEPQLGENIGTAARAMMNCGLDDLRLVRPRDGWPSDKAIAAASGADTVLAKARLYPDIPAAIADLVHVYAATARDRGMVRREVTPRHAAPEMRARIAAGEACGVLFGPERTGLLNDDVALADTVLTVPLNPGFSSLNLAQAVLIVGYEWFTSGVTAPPEILRTRAAAGRRPRRNSSISSSISRRS